MILLLSMFLRNMPQTSLMCGLLVSLLDFFLYVLQGNVSDFRIEHIGCQISSGKMFDDLGSN